MNRGTGAILKYNQFKMQKFKIVPLSREYAQEIRTAGKDHFGHELITQLATGLGPCRVSLKPFRKGEDRRILMTHSPFTIENAYNQPGPIFINAENVEEYQDIYRFPPDIINDGVHFLITLIGYTEDQMMKLTRLCKVGESVDRAIEEILDTRTDIAYLHARNAIACCYVCRIERNIGAE
jgi:Protein of unknown function (DUF1203)